MSDEGLFAAFLTALPTLFKAFGDLVSAGHSPASAVTRMTDSAKARGEAEAGFQAAIDAKFGEPGKP